MPFCGFVPGFAAQMPGSMQYHAFQQPMVMAVPSPQVLTIQPQQQQQVQPVLPLTMMMVSPPPIFVVPAAFPLSLPLAPTSVLPPGAPTGQLPSSGGLKMRVVFYGHSDGYALTEASWGPDNVPSRDGLLAALATWAGHHGIAIRHAGGRIDVAKVKAYVMPRGSGLRGGGMCGLRVEKGAEGLVSTGDVVKVLGLDVDEGLPKFEAHERCKLA
ncbi:hypothetical protein J3F83DRAFT_719231 [Trichoderma novae-zelandiae]